MLIGGDASKDARRACHLCKAKTAWFCGGCRRYLCNSPPNPIAPPKAKKKKKGDDSDGDGVASQQVKKLPKQFVRKVPKLNPETGEVQLDKVTGEPIFVSEYGEYTCYLHCHCKKWEEKSKEKHKTLMQDISKKHRRSLG